MKAVNDRIVVRVNMQQKDSMLVGGILLSTATKFEANYRERSPVIAEVVNGNKFLVPGDIIITHHNHFYSPSPYFMYDDLFSIPFNKTIFAKVSNKGNLIPVCGNILGERIPIKTQLELPPEMQKKYVDRVLVTHKGWTPYKPGQIVFTRANAPYDIVWNWKGEERRVTKVNSEMITGILVSK